MSVEKVRNALFAGFLLFVVIPSSFSLLGLITGETTVDDVNEFITGQAEPWWIDFAVAVPFLFVIFLVIVAIVGAEDIL